MSDDDYVYDEDSGEWMPASELAAKRAAESAVEVRDAVGNLLADGDQVTLIKDLTVKGAGQVLEAGDADQVDPPYRRRAGDRLPVRRDQGAGAARGIRAQALMRPARAAERGTWRLPRH